MIEKRNLVFILFLNIILGCSDIQDTFYNNLADVKKSNAIEKGWIPNILPGSSSEIYERHNLDTNEVWIRFKFNNKELKELIALLEEVNPAEINEIKFSNPLLVTWWPHKFNKDFFNSKQKQVMFKIYKYKRIITYSNNRTKTIPSFLVINRTSNIAYYWQYGI